jgi:hypothetical protein
MLALSYAQPIAEGAGHKTAQLLGLEEKPKEGRGRMKWKLPLVLVLLALLAGESVRAGTMFFFNVGQGSAGDGGCNGTLDLSAGCTLGMIPVSKVPTVHTYGTGYRIEIAPKCFLRWQVEPKPEGLVMVIDAPTLTNYAKVDPFNDKIELPLRCLPQ